MSDFESIYTDKQRSSKIKKEKKRLAKIFENIDARKRETSEKLIDEAAFMAVTLDETRQIITRDGIVETYQNGANQSGIKKSSAVEVYDKMINTYSKVIKQLCELLPEEQKNAQSDPAEELLRFTSQRR